MITADSASFQSLHMIRDELIATIEQAARDLEVFVSSYEEIKSLQACVAGVRQVLGILRLLELKGASMLAEELLITSSKIEPGQPTSAMEKQLELVSGTFFVLTRYIEYVLQAERRVPVLLIPYINDLRKFRREPVLPESFFSPITMVSIPTAPAADPIHVSDAEFRPLLARLRHMYQLGLLGVFRGKQTLASLGLMRRALIRLQRIGNDKPLAVLWWMSNLTIDLMIQEKMEVIEPRKMLLSRIDRIIRQVQKGGLVAYEATPPKGLLKELMYLILLSGVRSEQIKVLQQSVGSSPLPYSEQQLAAERRALQGPSAHTISTLVRVLRTEINNIKKVLEMAAQGAHAVDDVDGLQASLNSIAETLGVVGLVGPRSILKDEVKRVGSWQSGKSIDEDELDRVAKALLYVESSVNSLEFSKASKQRFLAANTASQKDVIASSELAQAEQLVLQECESGLSLTKRAITSYSDSNFDSSHISNIAKTLNSVRGGLLMLKRMRAAAVLQQCVAFVERVLMGKEHPPALKELLETFADAVISVEYYFDSAATADRLDDSVLQIAEESLAALGFPVRKAD